MSNPLYKLEVTKDYDDLPILRKKDVYLMQAYVDGGFRNTELKSLNFVKESIQAVTLVDIITAEGNLISHQSYDTVETMSYARNYGGQKYQQRTKCLNHSSLCGKCSQQVFHQPKFNHHPTNLQWPLSGQLC